MTEHRLLRTGEGSGFGDGNESSAGSLAIGVDIGGSSLKAGLVDIGHGHIVGERLEVPTPQPATPAALATGVAELVNMWDSSLPVGVTIPAVVRGGKVWTSANIDPSWVGCHGQRVLADAVGRTITLINDADAAGLAEVLFGAAQGVDGVVLVVTLGTGTGTALFTDGHLVPNTELGHLNHSDGFDMCNWTASAAMWRDGVGWDEWAARLQTYLAHARDMVWPDLVVLGGGVSKDSDRFLPFIDIGVPVVIAHLGNSGGVVGAALRAVM